MQPHSSQLSAQRQIERHGVVTAGHESKVLVEVLCFIPLGINHQRIGANLFARLQTPLNCTTDQYASQATPAVFCMRCQSPHSETRDRVAWQFLLDSLVKLFDVNLRRTQTVVAQYSAGRLSIDQNPNDSDTFFALLGRKTLNVNIELLNTRGKRLAIMSGGIKKLFLKHV